MPSRGTPGPFFFQFVEGEEEGGEGAFGRSRRRRRRRRSDAMGGSGGGGKWRVGGWVGCV